MKKFVFSFFVFFLSAQLFSQTKRFSLEIKTDDKPSAHNFGYWQEVKISSKDTSFVFPLHKKSLHSHENIQDIIKNLKAETYTVTITSLFNHQIQKKIELNKNSTVKFSGLETFYKLSPETINLSEKIKLNDTLYIIFNSTQNENTKEKIGITKTKTGYTAIQYVGVSNEVFQEMQINETSYKAVIKLEKEIKLKIEGKKGDSSKPINATINESYTIELNKEFASFVIFGQWKGMDSLKAVLFLVEQK